MLKVKPLQASTQTRHSLKYKYSKWVMQTYLQAGQYFWRGQCALKAIQFSNRKLDLFWQMHISHHSNRHPKQKNDGNGSSIVVCISSISSHFASLSTDCLIGYQFSHLHLHIFSISPCPEMILFSACCICGLIGGILNFQFVRALNKRPDSMHSIHLAAMTLACLGKQTPQKMISQHNKPWCNATQHKKSLLMDECECVFY